MRKNTKLFVLCIALLTVCLAMTSFAAGFNKVTEYKGTFTDVPENQWYAKEVAAAYELGFVNGKSDTTFDPNGTMTVAEAVTVASRVHASYNGKTIPEVSGAKWYDMYIQYALDNGIMDDGYFNSFDRTVRRYEMAVLFANALPESHFAAKNNVTAIPDVNEAEEYADKLLMLYKAGVVLGSDDYGTFHPTNPIKRSEVAAIVNRTALPENRVSGELLALPDMKEAYYLIDNYTMTSEARQMTRLASGWNYDNRDEQYIVADDAVQAVITDFSNEHYSAINRDFEVQTEGVMTFITEYTVNLNGKDGLRYYFTDTDGKSVVEFITKDGVYSAVSGGKTYKGTAEASRGKHVLKAVIDLDNKKGSLIVDGVKSCDFEIAPFKDFARINLSTTVEDQISVSLSKCHLYMNYAVNEDFIATAYPCDWEKAENAEVIFGLFDGYGSGTLKLTGNTTVTKKFDAISGKFVLETYVFVPEKADVAEIGVGDVVVKLNNSVISAGSLTKNYKNHVWQCIHIEGDTNTNKAKFYVNGKIQGEVPMNADSIDKVSFKYEKKTEGGYMYVDDVEVYNIYDYIDYCPVPNPVNRDDDHTVIMSVCSLWREGTHYGWDYVSPWDETTPLLGYYDEGIPETADWETKIMVEHGVDAFQYCWYYGGDKAWKDPQKSPRLSWSQHDGYFYSKYSDMIKFCFMWENAAFGEGTKVTIEQFKEYIWDYWVEWYFTDPRYLCIDNKPVLHIYRMDYLEKNFGSIEECNKLMKFMREDILNYGFDGIIILCQTGDYSEANIEKFTQMGADGIMTYAWSNESAEPEWLFNKYDNAYETVQKQNSPLYIVPTLGTGRNIMGWKNVRTPLATVEQHNRVLEYYKTYVQKQNIPGNMVYFGTWNEYGEGHWLAPSGLNGFGYADGWRAAYTNAPAVHDDVVPTINQQNRISKLYNDKRTPIRSQLLEKNEVPAVTIMKWDFANGDPIDGLIKPTRYQSISVENGLLTGVAAERDPIIRTTDQLNLNAADAIGIKLVLRSDVTTDGSVFFITDIDNVWRSDKKFSYRLIKSENGEFTEVYLDLTKNDLWTGTISQIRFDFIEEIGTVDIKSIEIIGAADATRVIVDGFDLEYPLYYIQKTENEFYLAGDPDTSIYSALNMYYEWNRWTGKLFLKSANDTEFVFNVGSDKALVNGKEMTLAKPFYLYDGIPVLPMKFILDNAGHSYSNEGNFEIRIRDFDLGDVYAKRDAFQFEFDIHLDAEGWRTGNGTNTVENGNYIATAGVVNASATGHDVQLSLKDVTINTALYSKIIVRIKPEYLPNLKEYKNANKVASVYFKTNKNTSLSEAQSVKVNLDELTPDADGYIVLEFDMASNEAWTGVANFLRFDPTNENGIYFIDYIRIVGADGTVPVVPSNPAEDKKEETTPEETTPEEDGEVTPESMMGNAVLVYDMDFVAEDDANAPTKFTRSTAEYKDGFIYLTAAPGEKDVIIALNLPEVLLNSANYDTAVVRLKADNWDRTQMFFMNETMSSYSGKANSTVTIANNPVKDAEGFYLIKIDLGANENWAGGIKSIRLDPGDIPDGSYIIDYVKFYKTGTTTNPVPAPVQPSAPQTESKDSEATGDGLLRKEDVKTPGVIVNGDAEGADISMYKVESGTLEVVTEDNGNKAFLITPTSGQKRWMYFTTPFNFIPGAKYKVEADLKVVSDEAGNTDIKTKITCNFRYQDTVHGLKNGYDHNAIIGKDQTPADGWVHFEGEYTVETMDADKNGKQDSFTFYCNPVGELGCKYMIDNIKVTVIG